VTQAYTFDNAGNTHTRNGPTGGSQVLTWDAEGRQVQIATDGATTTTDLYDADGARLIHRDNAAGTTLYLPGMELHRDTIGTVTGTRYYTFGGQTVASRTPSKLTWLFPDHQGTQQVSIDASTQAVSIRRQTPYGEPRGSQPAWPNAKGFVGGDIDATGLTHIGARYYDTTLGRFISVDPLLDTSDPVQFNAYQYGADNPITNSDPTGMIAKEVAESGTGQGVLPTNSKPAKKPCDTWCKMKHAGKGLIKGWTEANIQPIVGLWNMATGLVEYNSANYQAASNGDISWFQAAGNMWMALNVDLPLAVGKGMVDMVTGIYTEGKAAYESAKAGDWEGATYHATNSANDLVMTALTFVDGAGVAKAASVASKTARIGEGLEGLEDFGKTLPRKSCNSFTGGTLVALANGLSKPIQALKLGDMVLATDPVDGKTKPEPVTATIAGHGSKHLVDVTVDVDRGDAIGTVTATYNHPFWVANRHAWVEAIRLRPGDQMLTSDGRRVEYLGSSDWWQRTTVYNLIVAEQHTYYVIIGGTSVLVHNGGEWVDPNSLNFSQRTISANNYADLMRAGEWDWGRSPARVVDVDGQLVSYDNRRVDAAREAGVQARIERVSPADAHPDSTTGKTWWDKFTERFNDPRNIKAGGVVPDQGLSERPTVC